MSSGLCCVVDCYTNVSKHKDVAVYDFPDKVSERELRKRWVEAVKLANSEKPSWEPNTSCKVCSEHFLGNRRSYNPTDPNSVPTIFPLAKPIIPQIKRELCITVDDSDDYDSEVIEETSDCLFVVGKIKQEEEEELPKPCKNTIRNPTRKTDGRKIWKPKAATKRKIPRSSPAEKKQISSVIRENVASYPKKTKVTSPCNENDPLKYGGHKALFTGKFSSDSSDHDLDEDECGELYRDEEAGVPEKGFLSISDKVKVALKTPNEGHSEVDSQDYLFSSDEDLLLEKESLRGKQKRKPRFPSKRSQAALPDSEDYLLSLDKELQLKKENPGGKRKPGLPSNSSQAALHESEDCFLSSDEELLLTKESRRGKGKLRFPSRSPQGPSYDSEDYRFSPDEELLLKKESRRGKGKLRFLSKSPQAPSYDSEDYRLSPVEELLLTKESRRGKGKLRYPNESPQAALHDSEDYLPSSDEELLPTKKNKRGKRKLRFPSKSSQATLPGLCDGFVFCTSRDDDFNIGVQCNIFYEFTPISSTMGQSSSSNNPNAQKSTGYSLL